MFRFVLILAGAGLILSSCGKNPLSPGFDNGNPPTPDSRVIAGGRIDISFNYYGQPQSGSLCKISRPDGSFVQVALDASGNGHYICDLNGDYTVALQPYQNCPGYSKTLTINSGKTSAVAFTEARTASIQLKSANLNYGAVSNSIVYTVSYTDTSTVPVPLIVSCSSLPAGWSSSIVSVQNNTSSDISVSYPDFFSGSAPTYTISGVANGSTILTNTSTAVKNFTDPIFATGTINIYGNATNYFSITISRNNGIPLDAWTAAMTSANAPGSLPHDIRPYLTFKNGGAINSVQWQQVINAQIGDAYYYQCDYSITSNYYPSNYCWLYGNVPWTGSFQGSYRYDGTSAVQITFKGKTWTINPPLTYPYYQ